MLICILFLVGIVHIDAIINELCGKGEYYENNVGCKNCPPGQYNMLDHQTKCTQCEAGKYAVNERSTTCTYCDAGKVSYVIGASSQAVCGCCPGGRLHHTSFGFSRSCQPKSCAASSTSASVACGTVKSMTPSMRVNSVSGSSAKDGPENG